MSKRHAREHGRILSVDEETLGSVLVADAASGATTLYVDDAAEFEDDGTGGWLSVNDQVIAYDTVDDDAGTIHLKTALTAAADDGDPVYLWSKLYDTAATVKTALVMVDGEDENTDPVHATLADAVQDLEEGLRGEAGESCTLKRVSDDEWEITAVGGKPSSVKAGGIRFEADDFYFLTAGDITAGTATFPLSHRPADESMVAFWRTTPQEPSEYTVDYDAHTVTWPLEGFEKAGDRLWVHYAYRKGLRSAFVLDWASPGWKHLQVATGDTEAKAAVGYDDSGWAVHAAPFGNNAGFLPGEWPAAATAWGVNSELWIRRSVDLGSQTNVKVTVRVDNSCKVFWNGTQVGAGGNVSEFGPIDVPNELLADTNLIAVHAEDHGGTTYLDVRIEAS